MQNLSGCGWTYLCTVQLDMAMLAAPVSLSVVLRQVVAAPFASCDLSVNGTELLNPSLHSRSSARPRVVALNIRRNSRY